MNSLFEGVCETMKMCLCVKKIEIQTKYQTNLFILDLHHSKHCFFIIIWL